MTKNGSKFICDKCNGKGCYPPRKRIDVIVCKKCNGKGTVDWIENAVGVKEKDINEELSEYDINLDSLGDIGCH
ncbi:MAG: hypothetical protein PVG65_07035 [Candidatus Thorarchaeota archaeon]|jgi:hypothetical protein